jgi:hypothetical protein
MSDLAYRTLLAAIDGLPESHTVTVDLIRDQCAAAQLTSAEKSGAFRAACGEGYLRGVFMLLPGWSLTPIHAAVPSTHPAGKGRHVKVYRRTAKPVPEHLCRVSEPSEVAA